MEFSAIMKTAAFMGDHSECCYLAIDCKPTDTIELLFEKAKKTVPVGKVYATDEITLRIVTSVEQLTTT